MTSAISTLVRKLASLAKSFMSRLSGRDDSEHEQAIVRMAIGIASFSYAWLFALDETNRSFWIALTLITIGYSLGIFLAILINPKISAFRRVLSIFGDIGIMSIFMYSTREAGAPWWPVYLWVILGYGFRYNEKYLYIASAFAFICFGSILVTNDYWLSNAGIGIGLLISLIAIPAYASTLLRKLNETMKNLKKAQNAAEEANRAKSDFLARMSHEIRTPLNGIIGSSELLQSCELGREQKEYANTIYASGHNLLHLIEDILDISKIEAGKLTIEHTDFDLHNLLHTTVRMFSQRAEEKGLSLSCQIGLDTPYKLIGDPHHFRQILNNLLGNAIKFTEKGSVDMRCHVRRNDEDLVLIRFEVIDTGIGIPEDVQDRIFDKFAQADESTTRRFGGTGLGTAITKQLVELMGGRIGLQSTPGIGSTFWFDIEFERQPDVLDDDQDAVKLRDCKTLRLTMNNRATSAISAALNRWDISFRDVTSKRDAIRMLLDAAAHSTPFEVLILDGIQVNEDTCSFVESLGNELSIPQITVLLSLPPGQPKPSLEMKHHQVYVFSEPLDKALLFNALHASHASRYESDDIISLTDHFINEHQTQQKYKILVAEDNEVNRMVIGRILDRKGHAHKLVENGEELLKALLEEKFDLVITDMHMPVVSGIEAYKLYRFAHASEEQIPFIMLTANATMEARRECREIGIKHFLTKPVSTQKLVESISHATSDIPNAIDTDFSKQASSKSNSRANSPSIIDRKILNDIIDLAQGKGFLTRLIHRFEQDSKQLLQGMEEALKCADYSHFKDLAHALKGSSLYLGLIELTNLSSTAQFMSDQEIKSKGEAHLATMRKAFMRAISILAKELDLKKPVSH